MTQDDKLILGALALFVLYRWNKKSTVTQAIDTVARPVAVANQTEQPAFSGTDSPHNTDEFGYPVF